MIVVLLGPPGAGKGSLANALKKSQGLLHVSTGDLLREEIKNQTAIGLEAKKLIDRGELVPDELVTKLVEQRLSSGDYLKIGCMLDGFPRTTVQAKDLDVILKKLKTQITCAFYLEATLSVINQRLGGRRVCKQCGALFHIKNKPSKKEGICDQCGGQLYQRADDNEATIKNRMDIYLKTTRPIVDYYEAMNKLVKVDGDKETEDLETIVKKTFDEGGILNKH